MARPPGGLDRLLEDERIEIDAMSGTSAGAMNAAALVHGMARGVRQAAGQGTVGFLAGCQSHSLLEPGTVDVCRHSSGTVEP